MAKAQYYPSWYNPNELWLPQGIKNAPQMALPDGKLFTVVNKRTDVVSHDIIGRGGVRAVMDTGAADDDRINWNHSNLFANAGKSPGGSYGSSTLSQQDVYNAAQTVPLAYCEADEMAEGDPWGTPYQAPQYSWWLDARKAIYDAAGKPYRNFGTYGSFSVQNGDPWEFMTGDGSQKAPNDPGFKATLQSQEAARKRPFSGASVDYFGYFWPKGVGAIIKHYCDRPDYASRYYNKAYAAEQMALGMGAPRGIPPEKLIYLDWGKLEGLGDDWADIHNGFYYDRQVGSLGRIRCEEHPQIDFHFEVGCIFMIGFIRTSGHIIFDDRNRYGTNPLLTKDIGRPRQWIPGSQQNPPDSNEGYPVEPCGWHDTAFFASNLYRQTARTAGKAWEYCRYKVKNTENWIEVTSDHTDILEHAAANSGAYSMDGNARRGRCDVLKRVNNTAADIALFDPSRVMQTKETIIVNPVGDKMFEYVVEGSKADLYNETV